METMYDTSEIMKIIGSQYPQNIVGGGAVAGNDFKEVLETHIKGGGIDFYGLAIDVFMLGFMYGKKAERAARNGRVLEPLKKG